jgi:MFS-type transporter involved in bile tolerance (Atg22 family)
MKKLVIPSDEDVFNSTRLELIEEAKEKAQQSVKNYIGFRVIAVFSIILMIIVVVIKTVEKNFNPTNDLTFCLAAIILIMITIPLAIIVAKKVELGAKATEKEINKTLKEAIDNKIRVCNKLGTKDNTVNQEFLKRKINFLMKMKEKL